MFGSWRQKCEMKFLMDLRGRMGHRSKSASSESNSVQDLNRWPVLENSVCSDFNQTAQQLWMAALKSLETMSGMILNRLQTKFAAKMNEMRCWKPWRYLHWLDQLRFSIWWFFQQSTTENNHLLCYWSSIHYSISKSSFHFSLFWGWCAAWWALSKTCAKRNRIELQSMSKAIA